MKHEPVYGKYFEDVYDSYYDTYLDKIQDIVDVTYECSECGKECCAIAHDHSFGFEHGMLKSTHRDIEVLSDCCEAPVVVR